MNKRLMLTILFLSFSVSLFSQVNPDTLPEKYVKKVIIDAKWGKGPGEFGINLNSDPITAPGGISIDKNGDIYILDNANRRIQRFNKYGELLSIFKVSCYGLIFGVKEGMIYSGGSIPDTLALINVESGKEMLINLSLPGARSWAEAIPIGYIKGEKLVIEQSTPNFKTKIWKLNKVDKNCAYFSEFSDTLIKNTEKDFSIEIEEGKEIIIKRGVETQTVDKKGNCYFEKRWSSDTLKVIKVSPKGDLLAIISLPIMNYFAGDYTPQNPVITSSGDIYYLYPTGELKIENWKKKFIPGKVQVIKWELQK